MRKWLRRLLIGTAGLCLLIGLSALGIYLFIVEKPADNVPLTAIQPYQWNKIDLNIGTVSSDGSPYYVWARKGEQPNWIIFFSGGGIAWDGPSAEEPIQLTNLLRGKDPGNYFANIPFYMLTMLDGLLAHDREENPFRDWNVLYIPYATGDLHIGDRVALYEGTDGETLTMRYNGRHNVQAALAWLYDHVENPEKLLVAGESAGAFGAAFWAEEIANHYRDSAVYQYSDSAFLYSERWPQIINEEWQAMPEERTGFQPEADLIGAITRHNGSVSEGEAVVLQSYSLYDEVLIRYQRKLNGDESLTPDAWTIQLRESVAAMDAALPNYAYYLTDQDRDSESGMTPHTYATRGALYETEQDGISLLQWLDDVINGDQHYSVGESFLDGYR